MIKYAILLSVLLTICVDAVAKPVVNWLRPQESNVITKGNNITGGEQLQIMQFLSKDLIQFEHHFESYPLKRNWFLIKEQGNNNEIYCFFGASFRQERTEWGIYSAPTSIGLPISIVARKDAFKNYEDNETVSISTLFEHGFKVVLYDQVRNVWVDTVNKYKRYDESILRVSSLDANLNQHTLALIERGRIDFGYVSHREIKSRNLDDSNDFSVYQVKELADQVRRTSRVLCSKNALGESFIQSLNTSLAEISEDPLKSHQLRDLNFNAEGYRASIKDLYNTHWDSQFTFNK